MSILEVKNLSYSIKTKVLYEDSSFLIDKKNHCGIVGLNGTGKTTLIKILLNQIEHDNGEIIWQKNIKIGYLDQHAEVDLNLTIIDFLRLAFNHLYEIEKKIGELYVKMSESMSDEIIDEVEKLQNKLIYEDFYSIDERANKISAGLGINALGMDTKLSQLSGGQRAKVILAKLLLEKADVLIMDEPTNFLDKTHVDWLTKFLNNFENAYLIISHDFEFLNNVTNCILDIENKKITKYTGSYNQFVNLKEEHKKNLVSQFESQQGQIKKLQEYYDKWHAGTKAASAQSRLKQLEKIKENAVVLHSEVEAPTFVIKCTNPIVSRVLEINNLTIGYDKPLINNINLDLLGEEKIVIKGFNGIGKSTTIKTILGLVKPINGFYKWNANVKIGYFDQDLAWENPDLNAFEIIKNKFPNMEDLNIRKSLAQVALKGKLSMQPVKTLSGGEQVKIKLCLIMLEKNNVLILDEPTNHIDVKTKDRLKEQLMNWTGALILITHEHEFYEGWIENVIDIAKKK